MGKRLHIKSKVYLDSSSITLCLSIFDWEKYTHEKGTVKLHTLLDYEDRLPLLLTLPMGWWRTNTAACGIPIPADCTEVAYNAKYKYGVQRLTSDFKLAASQVATLYLAHWDIEVFFKQVKQTMYIKSFIGTRPEAVLMQVWTAMMAILLTKFLKMKV